MTDAKLKIALFYDGFERTAEEGLSGAVRSHARRILRYLYRTIRRRQVHTGFYTAFLGLVSSLRANGVEVKINDFSYARAHPTHPVGLAGYPSVIDKVRLPNPAIFGPGDPGMGERAVEVASQERMKVMSQPCEWAVELNRQWVGDKGAVYFAGIDTDAWPDKSGHPKSVDFLVYDKIRWHRDTRVDSVLNRCLAGLRDQGLTYQVVRYGHHHSDEFRAALARSGALLFLCEHETQGLAYQEAMSSGAPVLAWDQGELVDPHAIPTAPAGLAVSSVPYFDDRCGLRFKIEEFETVLSKFVEKRLLFRPREYVLDTLSLKKSGARYIELYELALRR